MKYAVIGATGQVGSATARALLNERVDVRVIVRRPEAALEWTAAGAEIAIADLADVDALAKAFSDVDGIFAMLPTFFESNDPAEANRAALRTLCEALTAADAPRVVYLSSIGAHHSHGLGAIGKLHDFETALNGLNVPSVAIRAGWFMDNHKSQVRSARESGILHSMLDPLDLSVPMISSTDIGNVAAMLLQRSSTPSSVVELAHPHAYSMNDVARAISTSIGRPVEAIVVPKDDRANIYRTWGLSQSAAESMAAMIDGFNSGWIRFEEGAVERIEAPITLAAAIQTFANADR
jgi:NAD(P)H dehydrogenase (quinone)